MLSRRVFLAQASALLAQDPTFTTGVDLVNLLATVRDKRGQLIRDLTQDDFEIKEMGRPQRISYFAQQSDLPLRIGLLIDTSISQEKVIPAERAAAYRFLDQVLREGIDKVFLIQFETLARVRLGFSDSREQLETTLNDIDTLTRRQMREAGGGGTAFFDAIASGSELMLSQTGRKALIVLSDGIDSSSDHNLQLTIERAQRADTLVYSVYFADPAFYWAGMPNGRGIMQRLASETGGAFFEISKRLTVEQIFSAIEADLRSQYGIGYVSDTPVGYPSFRKIQLSTRRPGLTVQTRAGYWPRRGAR